MSLAVAARVVTGVVIIAGRAFTRSALGMAFAAFGRDVPVLYSGPSAALAIASMGSRDGIAAVVVLDADTAEAREVVVDLLAAGCDVTVLLGAGVTADAVGDLRVCVVEEHSAQVQDVIGGILGSTTSTASTAAAPAFVPLALSDMQRRVLAMFATGASLTDIAKELGVRPETVRTHLKRVRARYREVGIHLPSRRDLYQVARMSGLVA